MAKKFIYEKRIVPVEYWECDGPSHLGKIIDPCIPMELSHGYGSPYDGSTQTFCGLDCLREWTENPPSPETVESIYNSPIDI